MSKPATIAVLRGPDEGRTFPVDEEVVHVGLDGENQIKLTDTTLQDHQASIVRRNGRYAIFTPVADGVEVDGNRIPAEQWVWLPATARIRFGTTTLAQFSDPAGTNSAEPADVPKDNPVAPPPQRKKRTSRRSKSADQSTVGSAKRKVAKFITDQGGDQLVRLGEDGKLPELALNDSDRPKKAERKKSEGGSPALYIAIGISLLMSLFMLFFDPSEFSSSARTKAEARQKIVQFYGKDGELKPYQMYLREARRAHSVGDRAAERRAYKRVLDELNAEDAVRSLTGLTGDKKGDDELRELIGQLLSP